MKVLIVDDHALFGDGLSMTLTRLHAANHMDTPLEILRAASEAEATSILEQHDTLDLALLDLDLPDGHGMSVLKNIQQKLPKCPVMIISALEKQSEIMRVLDAGASGFLPKSSPTEVTIPALQLVLSGGRYLPPQLLAEKPREHALTDRQIEVLKYIHDGLSNKVIAREMELSESTVKAHIRQIFSVLEAKSRSHAVNIAIQSGVL